VVSILIPSYNHARYLPACLASIQAQTVEDWEVILVDDGSKDDSVAIARELARQEPRLKVHVNETNLGTYGTEQKALELSRGEFIAVMNSDDLWAPEKLARQLEILAAHPECPLVYTLGWKVDDAGNVETSEDVHADWPQETVQDPLPHLLYENRILASGVLFRRRGTRFEPTCRYSGDWVALLEHLRLHPAACLSDRLTFWRMHATNSFVRSEAQLFEEIRVRAAILADPARWYQPRLTRAEVDRGLAKNAQMLSYLYLEVRSRALAQQAAVTSLRYAPNKKAALRRLVLTFLPHQVIRRRLWHGPETYVQLGFTPAHVAKRLAENPPLLFRDAT